MNSTFDEIVTRSAPKLADQHVQPLVILAGGIVLAGLAVGARRLWLYAWQSGWLAGHVDGLTEGRNSFSEPTP